MDVVKLLSNITLHIDELSVGLHTGYIYINTVTGTTFICLGKVNVDGKYMKDLVLQLGTIEAVRKCLQNSSSVSSIVKVVKDIDRRYELYEYDWKSIQDIRKIAYRLSNVRMSKFILELINLETTQRGVN